MPCAVRSTPCRWRWGYTFPLASEGWSTNHSIPAFVRLPSGKPDVRLSGRMRARAERLGVRSITVSISHSRDNAVAVAIAERASEGESRS